MKKRIEWIDYCKGWAIVLVILGHCITRMGSTGIEGIINLVIYSFHMPLFFFISGFNLNTTCSLREFTIKKVKGILLPGYLFMIFLLIYKLIDTNGAIISNGNFGISEIYHFLFMTSKSIISEYWFLPALFVGEVICFILLKKVKDYRKLCCISFCIIVIAMLENRMIDISFPFCFEIGAVSILFILTGYLCKENENIIHNKIKSKTFIIACAIFLLGNAMQYVLKLGKVNFNLLEIRNIVTFLVNAFAGVYIMVTVSKEMNHQYLINYLGKRSLYVFGFHYFFLEICCKLEAMISVKGASILFTVVITVFCFCACKIRDWVKK